MPKASLNCWMAEWEKDSKILAFLGILKIGGGSKSCNITYVTKWFHWFSLMISHSFNLPKKECYSSWWENSTDHQFTIGQEILLWPGIWGWPGPAPRVAGPAALSSPSCCILLWATATDALHCWAGSQVLGWPAPGLADQTAACHLTWPCLGYTVSSGIVWFIPLAVLLLRIFIFIIL